LSYVISATQPGTYAIPAIRVPVDGVNLVTQPLRLVVGKDDTSAGGMPAAFLRLSATKTNVYVGELFPVEIKVYGITIDELQHPTLKSDGFTIGQQAPAIRSREQAGNVIYNVYTFPMSVAAAKAGNLTLG